MTTTDTLKPTTVDTSRVAGRRPLRLATIDELLAEVDRLCEADRAGWLTSVGNWSLGQSLNHLAVWAEYAYTPCPLRPPWLIRLIMRPMKGRILRKGMPAGVRIRGTANGTLGTDRVPLEEALPRFRSAYQRLAQDSPTAPSIIFGPLTQDEAIQLNLRHAELHLGFFQSDERKN